MSAVIQEVQRSLTTWIEYMPFAAGTAVGVVGDRNVKHTVPYVGPLVMPLLGVIGATVFRTQPIIRTVGEGLAFGAIASEILSLIFPSQFAGQASSPGQAGSDMVNAAIAGAIGAPAMLNGMGSGMNNVVGAVAAKFVPNQGFTTVNNQDQSATMGYFARPNETFSQANFSRPQQTFSNDGNNSFVAGFNY